MIHSANSRPGLVVRLKQAPARLSDFRLIAFDMDSTLINIECIDEIADAAGKKNQVAQITEAAMRGEITDFKESLRLRLSYLQGVPVSALDQIFQQKLQLNPGARELTMACKKAGLKLLLVSGGFTYFADRISELLQFDFSRSNLLEIENGCLTGRLLEQAWGTVCDGDAKQQMLLDTCAQLGIGANQAIAVGDGANDLPMMKACAEAGGISVAFHAKPMVREQALVSIETGGLDRLLEVFK
jgi:phosphoserine phosphatase